MWEPVITLELIVADVLSIWPETIPVFMRHRLGCVGCALARFDTLQDIARIYHLPADRFLEELEKAVQAGPSTMSFTV